MMVGATATVIEDAMVTSMAMAAMVGTIASAMEGAMATRRQCDGNNGDSNGRCDGNRNGMTARRWQGWQWTAQQ